MLYDSIRVAVFSDIHSNYAALEACLKDCKIFGVDEYIVAGDLISDWHQPKETLGAIRALTKLVIKGNREQYFCEYEKNRNLWHIYDQYASLLWTYQQLDHAERAYIAALPEALVITAGKKQIRVVHGSVFRMNELVYQKNGAKRLSQSLNAIHEDILLFGHSHEQWKFKYQNKLAINPGSVGVHFNKQQCAEYCILELKGSSIEVIFRLVAYDLDEAFLNMMKSELYSMAYVWVLVNYLGMTKGFPSISEFLRDIKEERLRSDITANGTIPNDIWHSVFERKYAPMVISDIIKIDL